MCAEFSKLFEIAWKPFFPLRLLTNKDRKKNYGGNMLPEFVKGETRKLFCLPGLVVL